MLALAQHELASRSLASLAGGEADDELAKTMIRSADGQVHLIISQPQTVPFSPDEHLFAAGEHIPLASEYHATTQTANHTASKAADSTSTSTNKPDPKQFISVLNNQSNIVFSVAQGSEGAPQRTLVGELADKRENALGLRYKWSLYDSRAVDSFDSQPQHYSSTNNNNNSTDSRQPITQSSLNSSSKERQQSESAPSPQKRVNVKMISYTTVKPASYKVTSTTLATPVRVSPKLATSPVAPQIAHYIAPSTGAAGRSPARFYNTLATETPSGGLTSHFRPTVLLHSWPAAAAAINAPHRAQLDSSEPFGAMSESDEEVQVHSQMHPRSPRDSSLEDFLRAAAAVAGTSLQAGQQEADQHQPAHRLRGELEVDSTRQLLHSQHEPMVTETRPETTSSTDLSGAHKSGFVSASFKQTQALDQATSDARQVALDTGKPPNDTSNNNSREVSTRNQQQTKESAGRQSIKQQPAGQAKRRKPVTNSVREADRELLVGPFKSESDAPATITLSGVVYQKSGSSSSILHRQVKQKQQQHPLGAAQQHRIAAAASSSSSASLTTEEPLVFGGAGPQEVSLDLLGVNSGGAELQLSMDSSSAASLGQHQNLLHHSLGGSPYASGSSSRPTMDSGLAELLLSAALKSSYPRQPTREEPMELSMESDSLLAQLDAGQHQQGSKQQSSFMATPEASFSLDEHELQQPQHQFQQQTPDSLVGGADSAGDELQSALEDQLDLAAENGAKLSGGGKLKRKPSMLMGAAEPFSATEHQSTGADGQLSDGPGSSTMQQLAKELQQSFYHQPPTSGKISNFGLQVAAAADDDQQFFSVGHKPFGGGGAAADAAEHQMLMSEPAPDEDLQLASSEARKKRPHGPIVIVQKDVKPVKYHLLRAYLALRRFIRPFEATYVFPGDPFGHMAGSLLGRRHHHLTGGSGVGAGPPPDDPTLPVSMHRQMGPPIQQHHSLLEQVAAASLQSIQPVRAPPPPPGPADWLAAKKLSQLGPQRIHHQHRHYPQHQLQHQPQPRARPQPVQYQHRRPPPQLQHRLLATQAAAAGPTGQVQVQSDAQVQVHAQTQPGQQAPVDKP